MILSFEQRHSAGHIARPCFGGGGGSSSSAQNTTTTTNNTDKRLVTDGSSTGVSADNSSVSITQNTTDAGAIQAGTSVALASIGSNANSLDHLLATADHLISQQQNSQQASMDLTKALAGTAQTAYSDAANQASGNKQLILAAIAVVGVVAFSSLRK